MAHLICSAGSREEAPPIITVDAHIHHTVVFLKDVLSAVAVMNVPVHYHDFLGARALSRPSSHSRVVEEAKAHGRPTLCMVPRGSADCGTAWSSAGCHSHCNVNASTGRKPGSRGSELVGIGVGCEVVGVFLSCENIAHQRWSVHRFQLFTCCFSDPEVVALVSRAASDDTSNGSLHTVWTLRVGAARTGFLVCFHPLIPSNYRSGWGWDSPPMAT
mmetsp:Transcript_18220/g.51038  ORF Transcript_18220/g.51038 Transcript_18220/m.51038 type:complete len:216 (+) Transcript_18220:1020-1667(+)